MLQGVFFWSVGFLVKENYTFFVEKEEKNGKIQQNRDLKHLMKNYQSIHGNS